VQKNKKFDKVAFATLFFDLFLFSSDKGLFVSSRETNNGKYPTKDL